MSNYLNPYEHKNELGFNLDELYSRQQIFDKHHVGSFQDSVNFLKTF